MQELNFYMYQYKCYLCAEHFQSHLEATNHLKSAHGIKVGDELQCMILHKNKMLCKTIFKSFKALHKHMKEKKCRAYYSSDVTQSLSDENSVEEWNSFVDEYGGLHSHSIYACMSTLFRIVIHR